MSMFNLNMLIYSRTCWYWVGKFHCGWANCGPNSWCNTGSWKYKWNRHKEEVYSQDKNGLGVFRHNELSRIKNLNWYWQISNEKSQSPLSNFSMTMNILFNAVEFQTVSIKLSIQIKPSYFIDSANSCTVARWAAITYLHFEVGSPGNDEYKLGAVNTMIP